MTLRERLGRWRQVLVFTGLLAVALVARGQDDRLVLNPPLGQAFPMELQGNGVKLRCPVLLNSRTILGPEVVLRFVYVDPTAGMHPREGGGGGGREIDNNLAEATAKGHDHGGVAADGSAAGDGGKDKATSAELHTEVWTEIGLFQEALNEANDLGTTIVYSKPGDNKPLSATLDLPDGMLLAEQGGHVTVLALSADSEAGEHGLAPGDVIESVGGKPVVALRDFMPMYFSVTQRARTNGQPYAFQVWRPGESRQVTVSVGAPPSLMHML